MKAAPRELLPNELESALLPIFQHIMTEVRDDRLDIKWDHFLPEWTRWVSMGFARTWECSGAVVGALFTHDLFGGHPRALLMFWFSTPEARRIGSPIRVLQSFEKAAEKFGAKPSASWNASISPERLLKVYQKTGYKMSEVILTKVTNG